MFNITLLIPRSMRNLLLICICGQLTSALYCDLKPILRGVSVKQDLGATHKKIYVSESDCKAKCAEETEFECTAILWPAGDGIGDCYLMDTVDLKREIFVDQRPFILYISVCDGDPTPAVGYCEFLLTQEGVTRTTDVQYVSPGASTESSCHEFCIANYRGQDCNAFVVSSERASTCTLYATVPDELASGDQNLWTKTCSAPPVNCAYTPWSEWTTCTASCGGGTRTRSRDISEPASETGVQCMDSEKQEEAECGVQECNKDCIYTEWTSFGVCNATCQSTSGFRVRTREVSREALDGGEPCSDKEKIDEKECAFTEECGDPCIYSTWTDWSTCSSVCLSTRSRTLEMGDPQSCLTEHGELNNTMVCEGDDCTSGNGGGPTTSSGSGGDGGMTTPSSGGEGGTPPTGPVDRSPTPMTTTTTVAAPTTLMEETGCKHANIDPSSRPSSVGFKAVGARADCALMCAQEQSFACEAYTTTGPGGPCVLHGSIDRNITILSYSRYYLQDINCKAGNSDNSAICEWKVTKKVSDPMFAAPGDYSSIGLTIDAPHCGTLCMMNHPIFNPKPCQAYVWNPTIGFTSGRDNCFMYNWNALGNATDGGDCDLYELVC